MSKTVPRITAALVSVALAAGLCPAFGSTAFAAEAEVEATAASAASASATSAAPTRSPVQALTIGNVTAQIAESDFTVEATGSTVKITGYTGTGGNVAIPSTIGGKTVTAIGEASFYGNTDITSISIPSTVKTIEAGAFANCTAIQSIQLANGIETIGSYAFQGAAVQSVTIPESVKTLGQSRGDEFSVFFSCSSLAQIQVAAGNTAYKAIDGVLYSKDGTALLCYPTGKTDARMSIPATVKTIENSAFYRNAHIQEIVIPSSVTKLGDWCFASTSIKSATIPASVTTVGDGPFDNCSELASLDYRTTAAQPYRMCEGCISLSSVKLPNGLKSIGFRAFKGCISLKSIAIPASVETIESTAFYECTGLTSIMIPARVTTIEGSAFCYCRNLQNVYGGSGVQYIGAYAFAYTAISSYPWSKKLRFASGVAFLGCDGFPNPDYPTYLEKTGSGDYRVYDDTYTIAGTADYAKAKEVLTLANKERAAQGVPNLTMDRTLQAAAMQRAAEIALLFSHTRPSGDDCFSAAAGMSGENIAAGSATASGVMNQWMNSSGHRANILSSGFTNIGIGCVKVGATTYWVQAFGTGSGASTYAGSGSQAASYKVDVNYDVVSLKGSGFNLNMVMNSPYMIEPGGKMELTVGILNPEWPGRYCPTSGASYTWKSSDSTVAKVSRAGVVTALSKAGKATISATTPGGKSWSIVVSVGKDISGASISGIPDRYYTGKAQKPSPTVTYKGKTLKKGTDYTVSYANNKKAGRASVTIKGKGIYSGKSTINFTIKQASNKAKATATKVSKSLKAKTLRSKARAVALPKVKATFGTAKWKVVKKDRTGTLTLKGSKIVVKKGAKKGLYTIKLKARVGKTSNYKGASTKPVTVKINVH